MNFQRQVAALEAVWASGAAAAKLVFEQAVTTVYATLADDEYGLLGAVSKQIGVAQIIRAWNLGEARRSEVLAAGNAEIAYVVAQNGADLAYEQTVTGVTAAAVAGLAGAAMTYAIAAAGNMGEVVAGLGAAAVGLAQNMKPVNVSFAGGVAAAEGPYHAGQADRAADRSADAAVGAAATSQLAFTAAEAQAEAA